ERTNIDVINLLCDIVDTHFAEDTKLVDRYPNSPCASKRNAKTLVTFVKDRPGHDRRYAVNASKISEGLGYAPQENFVNGLNKTVDWYLDNETWLAAILDGSYRD
ncbi:MAG: dTDP-glucose 4,6-dehydratase, partial [Gammaproteobacteria bacterium]|nr:dTDP-glucose 4,6-dehydratase [Gammaproteobacteria bacterium]